MPRMIFDLPADVQMAIRLRAVKEDLTTGRIVADAIRATFAKEVCEARTIIDEQNRLKNTLTQVD